MTLVYIGDLPRSVRRLDTLRATISGGGLPLPDGRPLAHQIGLDLVRVAATARRIYLTVVGPYVGLSAFDLLQYLTRKLPPRVFCEVHDEELSPTNRLVTILPDLVAQHVIALTGLRSPSRYTAAWRALRSHALDGAVVYMGEVESGDLQRGSLQLLQALERSNNYRLQTRNGPLSHWFMATRRYGDGDVDCVEAAPGPDVAAALEGEDGDGG